MPPMTESELAHIGLVVARDAVALEDRAETPNFYEMVLAHGVAPGREFDACMGYAHTEYWRLRA